MKHQALLFRSIYIGPRVGTRGDDFTSLLPPSSPPPKKTSFFSWSPRSSPPTSPTSPTSPKRSLFSWSPRSSPPSSPRSWLPSPSSMLSPRSSPRSSPPLSQFVYNKTPLEEFLKPVVDKEEEAIESAIKGIGQLLGLSDGDRDQAKTKIENNNNLKEIDILKRYDERVQKIIHSQLKIFEKIGITTINYFDTLTQIPTNKLKKVISDDDMDIIGKFKLA